MNHVVKALEAFVGLAILVAALVIGYALVVPVLASLSFAALGSWATLGSVVGGTVGVALLRDSRA